MKEKQFDCPFHFDIVDRICSIPVQNISVLLILGAVFGGVVPLEEDRLPLASTVEEFLTTDDNHPDLLWTNPRKLNNEWIRNRSPVYRYHSIYDPSFQQMNSNKETNFENLAPHWQTMRANKRLEWPEEVPRHKKIPENEIWATPVIPGDPSDLRKPRMVLRRSYEVGSHQKFDEDYAGESSSRRHTGVEGRHSNLDRHAEGSTSDK